MQVACSLKHLKSLYTFALADFAQQFIPAIVKASSVGGNPKKTMTNNNRNKGSNKILLIYSIVYSVITLCFISEMQRDQSASLGYVLLFPIFWAIAGLLLGLLFWLTKINIQTFVDKIAIVFSTPIPLLVFVFFWSLIPGSESPRMTREYNKEGHRCREVQYEYSSGKNKRIEYYIIQDKVTDENPFPVTDIWLKDSIWTYYTKDGQIEKTEDFRNK